MAEKRYKIGTQFCEECGAVTKAETSVAKSAIFSRYKCTECGHREIIMKPTRPKRQAMVSRPV